MVFCFIAWDVQPGIASPHVFHKQAVHAGKTALDRAAGLDLSEPPPLPLPPRPLFLCMCMSTVRVHFSFYTSVIFFTRGLLVTLGLALGKGC